MSENISQAPYLVLARKYRPNNFSELIGQETLVTTITNAIKRNRLHHAYILTGIRGIGKTTTARIIAKAFNCLETDNLDSQIPCGTCSNCLLIAASNHQDVIEFDAASRTGIDDIRDIISSIAYAPVNAKYKVYIIDEVHMLSNSAFNALLKTLEEPPTHVKFIFATTEIKKVPITILSRCQRFDLRRLDEPGLVNHLERILEKEGFKADRNALNLIANASEGSVRDSLSILDQALSSNNYQELLSTEVVEKMLNINDKNQVIELFNAVLVGNFKDAVTIFENFYSHSSDVTSLIHDLMEINYKITSSKLINGYKLDEYSKNQQEKIVEIASKISLGSLTKIWQMLLKGNLEVQGQYSVKIAFEMLLARMCYLESLPNLKTLLKQEDSVVSKPATPDEPRSREISNESRVEDEVVNEILRNFEGSKIINK